MKRRAMLMACVKLMGAKAPPPERVVSGDGVVTIKVNGKSARVRIDPAAAGLPLLTDTAADRLGLKKSRKLGIGFVFTVGTTRLSSKTQVARVDFGGGPAKQRVGWTERPFSAVAEGSVGPAGLPEPVVRFALREPQPGERTFSLPMAEVGFPMNLFGGGWVASSAQIYVGGEPMRIRFDPNHPRSLATAGAAARIARLNDGKLSGEAVQTEIWFGVERPVRTLNLARPLGVGNLSLTTLGVRIADAGNAAAIREEGAPVEATDPDEVVVIGKKKRDVRRDLLSLGADALSRCSSIVFDKPAKQVRLSCLP